MSNPILPGLSLILAWIGILLALVVGLLAIALKPESAMKFIISPRRVFTERELAWYRIIAVVGVVCFSYFIVWTAVRFLLQQRLR